MKMLKILFSITLVITCVIGSYGQNEDEILFTVEGNPVHVSEFNYIYNKNNGDKADYSKESVEEYLDLYKKFKLKVQKARDMELDTIPELITELAGYRKQLADSYLTDKEVSEKLVQQVYDRQQYDVKVRHIVVRTLKRATADEIQAAKDKIDAIYKEIKDGADFQEVAKVKSEDVNTKNQGGELNYLSAMLPNGYYEFENAMYELEEGEISEPIRSGVGFHIIQVIDKRPARGEIQVAHILLRKKEKGKFVSGVKSTADSIYQAIQDGASFEEMVTRYSQDGNTKGKGGDLGVFGISTYEKDFEDAAFGLEKDGDISKPVQTSIGWHILKRISKPEKPTYEKVRRKLQAEIKKDSRYEVAKEQMVEDIKKEANLVEYKDVLERFIADQDETFYSYKWKVDPSLQGDVFTLGDKDFSLIGFANAAKQNTRKRLRFSKTAPIKESIMELYNDYLKDQVLKYEEEHLEDKYPEFESLMREYREGILLFEATKINVWDKASQDTVGLRNFYEKNKGNYVWKERADLETYFVKTEDVKLVKKISKYVRKHSYEEVMQKLNSKENPITFDEGTYERGDLEISGIKFKEGAISDERYDVKTKTWKIRKIVKVYPSKQKTLKDARGYIIADYQDSLDKAWVKSLMDQYEVKVNQDVLDKLIQD
ncbi:peptidylprolyl isomerase [Portibacter lacus]|nr:peptidylprolyl isomerase [Portibacter lacus]